MEKCERRAQKNRNNNERPENMEEKTKQAISISGNNNNNNKIKSIRSQFLAEVSEDKMEGYKKEKAQVNIHESHRHMPR